MTEIICRLDIAKKQPVVFLTDSIDNGQITAWAGGQANVVGLDYYHQTGPLSAADEEVLRARYAKATADKSVKIRHRLPRVRRHLENILAKPAPAPTVQAAEHPAVLAVASLAALADPAPAPAPVVKEAKQTPTAPAVQAPAVQASPPAFTFDVAAALAGIRAEFDSKIEALLRAIPPRA